MRILIAIGMLMATTVAAYAAPRCRYLKSTPFREWLLWASLVQLQRSSGIAGANGNRRGPAMRIWLCVGILVASTISAYAGTTTVPEIDAVSGLSVLGLLGSIGALIWERRRKRHRTNPN